MLCYVKLCYVMLPNVNTGMTNDNRGCAYDVDYRNPKLCSIEGFHLTSLQQNLPSHSAPSGHVGSHKIWPNSLLLKLHKA